MTPRLEEPYVEFDWRALLYNGIGAAALGIVAAGLVNISALLAALTPYVEAPGEVSIMEPQLQWGATAAHLGRKALRRVGA